MSIHCIMRMITLSPYIPISPLQVYIISVTLQDTDIARHVERSGSLDDYNIVIYIHYIVEDNLYITLTIASVIVLM